MKRWLVIAAALLALFAVSAKMTLQLVEGGRAGALPEGTRISVPSGLELWFLDRELGVSGDAGQAGEALRARFRFVAPGIGGNVDDRPSFDVLSADMHELCNVALTVLTSEGTVGAEQIVIAIAERETEVGSSDPEVVKYFEAFRIDDGICTAEVF